MNLRLSFFGLEDPVGKDLQGTTFTGSEWFRRNGQVIGVVKDFHFASLHDKVQPVVFYLASAQTESCAWMEVRILSENMQRTIESMKTVWANVAGTRPFEFEFMDDAVASHYQAEDRFLKVFTTFSVLSIMLGGLGLFGLTAFAAKRRTKEIGIRRVMGASTATLIKVLSADFLKLVLIANVLAWPVTGWLMHQWLERQFAFHTPLPWWAFLVSGIVTVIIAFFSVSSRAFRAARGNPVNSLRDE